MSEGITAVLRRNLFHALQQGDLEQAGQVLEHLRQEDPLSEPTRGLELQFLLRSGRVVEAASLADQVVRLFPASARLQHLAGRAAYRMKDYRTAAERLQESHRIQPDWRNSWYLAKTLTQLGDFDEAARMLEGLLPDHTECYQDLAWLHERREQFDQALAAVEKYLQAYPQSEWAKAQQLRLRARIMDPQQLVRETQSVREYGEEIADAVVPQVLEALFRTGQAAEARQLVAERSRTSPQLGARLGWVCYRYQAYELATDLFTTVFKAQHGNPKFLAALEFAATRSGRAADVLRLYEAHAAADPRLYGRMRSLKRRAGL